MEKTNPPSRFIVVIRSRMHKTMSIGEAKKYKERLDAETKENYPWEARRAHIYGLVR